MLQETFKITGMTCANCKNVITKKVNNLANVSKAKVNLSLNTLKVEGNDNLSEQEIIKAVHEAGYKAEVLEDNDFKTKDLELTIMSIKFLLSLVLTLPMWIAMVLMLSKNHSDFSMFLHNPIFQASLTGVVEFVIGWKFFVEVFYGIKNKKTNMSFLVVVGTLSAIGLSIYNATQNNWQTNMSSHPLYFETAATIITLVLLGKVLETLAKNKTTNSLKSLTKLLPSKAVKLVDGKEIEVELKELKVGDIVVVKPGTSIPLDGIVIEGISYVNESMLTGESKPVKKTVGSEVVGASINNDGNLKIEITQIGKNTTISKIVELVKDAQTSEIEIQKTVDKISAWFIPIIFTLTIITFIAWSIYYKNFNEIAFVNSIAVLVIACPCALGLATPTAIMVGTGRAAQNGILFKGGNMIEKLAKVNTIIFDKTGTLTKGLMEVKEFEMLDKEFDRKLAIDILKSVEINSNHPIAKAISNWKVDNFKQLQVNSFENVTSYGIQANVENYFVRIGKPLWFNMDQRSIQQVEILQQKGQTVFVLEIDNKIIAFVSVSDSLKENAKKLIKQINDLNIETVLLTGDSNLAAESIGKELGIKTIYSETLVSQKAKVVEEFQNQGKIVAMVGDGINDSVALTKADIGISTNDSSGIAIDSSDVVLMKEDLLDVVKTIKAAKKTLGKIKTNLFWAFVYNSVAIPLAMFGILMPEIAALAMALSSVSVVINSLFLKIK
ncbi:P-type Cu+ transporter [Spiroplasma chinense]|uniref:P-type Cu+ transporter n=1 Tax=Spiroplasma chinense TaxID=216932 RepID=A0A5B9Y3L6_9MOLU|nr:cation-translocating P-type ATPase [Spiroplasma chinense]QEH61385.1 P-type Cu+ transporter [Spiroplasma chinense]